jgi:ABC transport system ATP-binding/permease protein
LTDRVVTSIIAAHGNGRWIEYAGGYADMLSQRKSAGSGNAPVKATVAKRPRPVTEVRTQLAARPPRMRLSDRRALETLPGRIEALQTKIAGLNAILADPDLYSRDPRRFDGTT